MEEETKFEEGMILVEDNSDGDDPFSKRWDPFGRFLIPTTNLDANYTLSTCPSVKISQLTFSYYA